VVGGVSPRPAPDVNDDEKAWPVLGYDAFLSYSHSTDARLAPAVRRCLQRMGKPWYRLRALRVFQDQTNLAANPDLWATIESALQRSGYFVLMASPQAAASPWVGREVGYWQTQRERETFLIAVTEGTIAWDEAANDFDWQYTTALPEQLRGWFTAEPLWVDLTWARDETQRSLRHSRFRDTVATLAATVHGMPKEDLEGEEIRQHRRTLRTVTSATALVVAALTTLSLVAFQQADDATAALRQAVSRELATQSQTLGDAQPGVSQLLSVAAWHLNPNTQARTAMVSALQRPGLAALPNQDEPIFSHDGRTLFTTDPNDRLMAWDMATHTLRAGPLTNPRDASGLAPDDQQVRIRDRASPDSQSVQLVDRMTGTPIGTPLPGHEPELSPNGRVTVTHGNDHTVHLWDSATHQELGPPLTRAADLASVRFTPDSHLLLVQGDDQTLRVWDIASHRLVGAIPNDGSSFEIGPDDRTVAISSRDPNIGDVVQLWDITNHRQIGAPLTGHTESVDALAFSPDGKTLATGSNDHTIRLWDMRSRQQIGAPLTSDTDGLNPLTFSPDGRTLVSSGDGTVRLWDVSGQIRRAEPRIADIASIGSLAFSPDGRTVALGGVDDLQLFDVASGDRLGAPLSTPRLDAQSLRFSPDGHTVTAVGGGFGDTQLWDVDVRTQRRLEPPWTTPEAQSTSLSPDGHTLAKASYDGTVTLWDVATHQQIGSPLTMDHTDPVQSAAFSPDGRTVATGYIDRTVQLWSVATHAPVGPRLTGHTRTVRTLAFSPDGRTLATGSDDHTVRLWDTTTHRQIGLPLTTPNPVGTLAFTPDSAMLASSSNLDNSVRLWDVATQTSIGDPLTTTSVDSPEGNEVQSDPHNDVTALAFSPDGHTLAGATYEDVRLWDVPSTAHPDATLCAHVGRSLSPEEWKQFVSPALPYQQICS